MALTAQIALSILAHETSSGDLSRTLRATPANYAIRLTDGTGANQAQVVWSDERSFSTASQDDIDLRSLSDDRGTVTFDAVKALYIKNRHSSQIEIVQGVGLANSWTGLGYADEAGLGAVIIPAGGAIALVAPDSSGLQVSQSGGYGKVLRIIASGAGTATYDIVLIGEGTVT